MPEVRHTSDEVRSGAAGGFRQCRCRRALAQGVKTQGVKAQGVKTQGQIYCMFGAGRVELNAPRRYVTRAAPLCHRHRPGPPRQYAVISVLL